jgi:hypothetical protein
LSHRAKQGQTHTQAYYDCDRKQTQSVFRTVHRYRPTPLIPLSLFKTITLGNKNLCA